MAAGSEYLARHPWLDEVGRFIERQPWRQFIEYADYYLKLAREAEAKKAAEERQREAMFKAFAERRAKDDEARLAAAAAERAKPKPPDTPKRRLQRLLMSVTQRSISGEFGKPTTYASEQLAAIRKAIDAASDNDDMLPRYQDELETWVALRRWDKEEPVMLRNDEKPPEE